jgi:hypothetical protein
MKTLLERMCIFLKIKKIDMKKNLFVLFFLANFCQAQITFEHMYSITVPEQEIIFPTDLGNNNFKYVLWDRYQDWFSLYNLDHSPYILNIPLPVTTDSGVVYKIGYITNSLFDCDSTTVEYAMMAQSGAYAPPFLVYRTDGTLIFSKDSVTVPYLYGDNVGSVEIHGITNTNAGAKLMLFNASNNPWKVYVYGLCGTLPENITEIGLNSNFVRAYPNPSGDDINFEIIPPSNTETYEFVISNASFQTIKTNIIEKKSEVKLQKETLVSGTYFYSLQNKNKILQTGKFIISK